MTRDYDVLLWGVTGWTGVHLAEYFAENYPLGDDDVTWAMCGRSKIKLENVVERLVKQGYTWADDVECIEVNNLDEERVLEVVSRGKCVATVVGPYSKYGESVVKACVEAGTHYCDITGETPFVRRMIEKYHDEAMEKGVFIVPCCGFDSVPSDLGVRTMVNFMNDQLGQPCKHIRGYLCSAKGNNAVQKESGGGGTIASALGAVEAPFEAFADPYYLTGADDKSKGDRRHFPQLLLGYEKALRRYRYTTVFPMAFVNEKVVRRTNYLLGGAYGRKFSYHEGRGSSSFIRAALNSAMIIFGTMLLLIPFVRDLVKKFAPQPSSWPPEKPRGDKYKPGRFEFRFVGETEENVLCTGRVIGIDDAGWTETSKMLGESALTLVNDLEDVKTESRVRGGVVTPGILGTPLTLRLRAKGMTISAEKYKPKRKSKAV